jgi:hypothetical protein
MPWTGTAANPGGSGERWLDAGRTKEDSDLTQANTTGEIALQFVDEGAITKFQVVVTASEQIADGAAIVIDASSNPITIKTIELVYADEPPWTPSWGSIWCISLTAKKQGVR